MNIIMYRDPFFSDWKLCSDVTCSKCKKKQAYSRYLLNNSCINCNHFEELYYFEMSESPIFFKSKRVKEKFKERYSTLITFLELSDLKYNWYISEINIFPYFKLFIFMENGRELEFQFNINEKNEYNGIDRSRDFYPNLKNIDEDFDYIVSIISLIDGGDG